MNKEKLRTTTSHLKDYFKNNPHALSSGLVATGLLLEEERLEKIVKEEMKKASAKNE